MGYTLGVDLGTTWTGAALARGGQVTACTIESHQTLVPSLVHVDDTGSWAFGVAARRRADSDPDGLARAFKRNFGDPVPVILNGRPASGAELMGRLLAWVIDEISRQEDEAPELVVLSHPAHWSADQKARLRGAAKDHVADVEVGLISEPEAIAVHYAAERTPPEGLLAVYDFGGGTFDATILSSTSNGFAVIGEPVGRSRVGGIDLDDLVVGWALDQLEPDVMSRIDRSDPVVARALRRLRDDAVEAKEALSTEAQTTISVGLPTVRQDLRLVRADFERLAGPLIDSTIDAVRDACAAAGTTTDELALILLAGGSSRVPLVAEMLAGELGVEVSTAVHPKLAVALGAAGSTLPVRTPPLPAPSPPPEPTPPPTATEPVTATTPPPTATEPVTATAPPPAATEPVTVSGSRLGVLAAVVGIVALAAAVWFTLLRGSDDTTQEPTATTIAAEVTTPGTLGVTAPATTEPATSLTSDSIDTTVITAQEMYQSGSQALMDFVTQTLPSNRIEASGFLVSDCQTKLVELQGNPAIGVQFAELRTEIEGYPDAAPVGYADPTGGATGFRDRFDLFATQVWDGYNACLAENSIDPVVDVIGAWSGALAFMCATTMFDLIPEDPTEVGGPTIPCATTDQTETQLCEGLADPLLTQFTGGEGDGAAACAKAFAPLESDPA